MTTQIERPAHIDPGTNDQSVREQRRGHIGRVVAGSLAAGIIAAASSTIVFAGGSAEPVITGLALASFALGWLSLWFFSARRTDQPQAWALVPAVVMATTGLACLALRPDDELFSAAGWVWPPATVLLTIWIFGQVRKSLRSWARPVLVYPVLLTLQVASVAGMYETVLEAHEQDDLASTGRLYDVGGHRLYLECTGTGTPTVILEAGLGEPSPAMSGWLAPAVAAETRVCSYDRAGYGRSEPGDGRADAQAVATDLHELLDAAGVPGPYVVAGHSTGALYARVFAEAYSEQVAGVVLIDGQPAEAMTQLPAFPAFYAGFRRAEALAPSLARLGVLRLAYNTSPSGLPEPARTQERAVGSAPSHYRTLREEFAALPGSLAAARAAGTLGAKPLVVVSAGTDTQEGWTPLQETMADLSSNSLHLTLVEATHASLVEDRDDAATTAAAIRAVVAAVRTGEPVRTPGLGDSP